LIGPSGSSKTTLPLRFCQEQKEQLLANGVLFIERNLMVWHKFFSYVKKEAFLIKVFTVDHSTLNDEQVEE